jgi:hypothetical protein
VILSTLEDVLFAEGITHMYRFLLIGLTILASGGAAQAAPQILGLVATGPGPTMLHCRDGICSAHFTTFCLQQSRDAPMLGTAYVAADDASLQLVVTGRDGRQRTIPAQNLRIETAQNYTSVRISVPERQIRALGGAAVALAVAPRATLLPKAFAGDPSPQSAAEIALATGEHRSIGEAEVDRGGALSEAVGTIMTMINALNARDTGRGGRDAAADAGLAHAILADSRTAGPEREMLRDRVDLCSGLAANAWYRDGLSSCLESFHDSYVTTLTGRYWDAAATGF